MMCLLTQPIHRIHNANSSGKPTAIVAISSSVIPTEDMVVYLFPKVLYVVVQRTKRLFRLYRYPR